MKVAYNKGFTKSNQVGQTPNMIRDSRFHRGRHAKAGMYAAEIVIGEVQGDGSLQVLPFLAESVRKPSQSANLHPHR